MEINITWNICRVCLIEEEKNPQIPDEVVPMRHIFDEDEMLAKQIFECSGITMKPNDNLPDKICKKCLTMVKYAVNFRNICRASDTYLQSILQRTKSASELFKPKQMENLSEEFNYNDVALDDASEVKAINHKEANLDKRTNKLPKDSTSEETYSKSSAHEMNNIGKVIEILDCQSSNQMTTSDLKNSQHELIVNDIEDNEECKINEKPENSLVQDLQENSITSENEDVEEKYETDLNNLTTNNDNKKENVSVSEIEQNVDDEYLIESYEQEDDNSQLTNFEGVSSQEMLHHLVSDVGRNQTQVSSSTVMTKEYDIEIDEEDCSIFSETNGIQTEYIVDEYLIDASSSDVSLRKSAVVTLNSKMRKKHSKTKKEGSTTKYSPISSSSLKAVSDYQVVWICDLCGNHFGNRNLLRSHMKIHRQEKKHECEICSKRFITACNLQAHMRVHTGEKPFECQYCERRFSDRSSNLRHERTHTNEKPFPCKDCGKAFSLSTTLKKHLKVHTDERSYRCDICRKSFKLPHQLKAHKNSSIHRAVELLEQ